MIDITYVIELLITIISLLVSAFLIPYLKSKTSKEKQQQINTLVKIAVAAAEQIYQGSGRGAEKKEYVINWLYSNKITFDSAKIDAMIEAAVYELKLNGLIIAENSTNNG